MSRAKALWCLRTLSSTRGKAPCCYLWRNSGLSARSNAQWDVQISVFLRVAFSMSPPRAVFVPQGCDNWLSVRQAILYVLSPPSWEQSTQPSWHLSRLHHFKNSLLGQWHSPLVYEWEYWGLEKLCLAGLGSLCPPATDSYFVTQLVLVLKIDCFFSTNLPWVLIFLEA